MYPFPEIDPNELLGLARSLQRVSLAGQTQPLLKGRELALLAGPDAAQASLFERAAAELGGRVSRVSLELTLDSSMQDCKRSARLLQQLYDAIECQGLDARIVHRLRQVCTLPIFNGLASAAHPTALLAAQLDAASPPDDARRFVVQAALVWACQNPVGSGLPQGAGAMRSSVLRSR